MEEGIRENEKIIPIKNISKKECQQLGGKYDDTHSICYVPRRQLTRKEQFLKDMRYFKQGLTESKSISAGIVSIGASLGFGKVTPAIVTAVGVTKGVYKTVVCGGIEKEAIETLLKEGDWEKFKQIEKEYIKRGCGTKNDLRKIVFAY